MLGGEQLEICFAGQKFVWTFLLAKVDFAVLGADFLKHFHLVVDLAAQVRSRATCGDRRAAAVQQGLWR
jgi:hypothetical protein